MKTRRFHALCTSVLALGITGACGSDDDAPAEQPDARGQEGPLADAAPIVTPDAGDETRFMIEWTLAGGCLGGDEVETVASSRSDGRTFAKRFPCSAGSGLSDPVSPGDYDVVLRVFDNDVVVPPDAGPTAGPLVAESDTSGPHTAVENSTVTVAIAFPTNTSTIESAWSFSSGKDAQTCAEAGVVNVDVEYERVGGAIERELRVPCVDGSDLSGDLPTGLYLVRATPVDGAGATVFAELEAEVSLFVGNVPGSATFGFIQPQM